MRHTVLIVAAMVTAAGHALATPPVMWKVVGVTDGDTLTAVDSDDVRHKIRLQGIDAPEVGQPFGTKARQMLGDMTVRKTVTVRLHGRDRFGRDLARVEVDGRDVGLALVTDGMAWQYDRYDSSPELADAEREARNARRGLWSEDDPVPPWEWRATERERKAAARRPTGR